MRMKMLLVASWLGLWALAGPAEAQVEQLSLNFSKIEFDYRPAQSGDLPLALDVVVGHQGSATLRFAPGQQLNFQQAQFHPAQPAQAWLGFELRERGSAQGQLLVGVDQEIDSAGPGGGPHVKILDVNGIQSLHSGGANVALGDGSVRFIRDSVDIHLYGAPASLFNQPGPGEPLVARLPSPAPGQTIELVLKVWDDRGASTALPVRISNPR